MPPSCALRKMHVSKALGYSLVFITPKVEEWNPKIFHKKYFQELLDNGKKISILSTASRLSI